MHSSAMVCFFLPPPLADAVSLSDGVPASELHITLTVIPDREQYAQADKESMIGQLLALAKDASPLAGTLGGIGRFSASPTSDGMDVFYLSVDVPGLELLREECVLAVESAGLDVARDHGYTPHCTLKYLSPSDRLPLDRMPSMPLQLGTLCLMWGDERYEIPLPYIPITEAEATASDNPKTQKSHSAWFKKMVRRLAAKGVEDPKALAAYILRRKKAKEERDINGPDQEEACGSKH